MRSESIGNEQDRRDAAMATGGDRAAFGRLATRYVELLLRFARLLVPAERAAEDVAQDALLYAYRHPQGYRQDGSARAWLLALTRRAAWRHLRRRGAASARWLDFDDHAPVAELAVEAGWGGFDEEGQRVTERDRVRQLRASIAQLLPADRVILHLCDTERLSPIETAEALGIPVDTVRFRLHRARLRLMAMARSKDGRDGA